MKKFFCIGSAVALLLSLCSCGSNDGNATANSDTNPDFSINEPQAETTIPGVLAASEAFNRPGVWMVLRCPGELNRYCTANYVVEFDGANNARAYYVGYFGDWSFDDISRNGMTGDELVEWAESVVSGSNSEYGTVEFAPFSLKIALDGTGNATIAEQIKWSCGHQNDGSVKYDGYPFELDQQTYRIYDREYAGYQAAAWDEIPDENSWFVKDVTDDKAVSYVLDSPDSGIEIADF